MNLEYKKGFIHINSSPFRKIKLERLNEKPFPQRKKTFQIVVPPLKTVVG